MALKIGAKSPSNEGKNRKFFRTGVKAITWWRRTSGGLEEHAEWRELLGASLLRRRARGAGWTTAGARAVVALMARGGRRWRRTRRARVLPPLAGTARPASHHDRRGACGLGFHGGCARVYVRNGLRKSRRSFA